MAGWILGKMSEDMSEYMPWNPMVGITGIQAIVFLQFRQIEFYVQLNSCKYLQRAKASQSQLERCKIQSQSSKEIDRWYQHKIYRDDRNNTPTQINKHTRGHFIPPGKALDGFWWFSDVRDPNSWWLNRIYGFESTIASRSIPTVALQSPPKKC